MARTDRKRSLTEEEHTIRLRFNAAHRDDPHRVELWTDLTKARARGARHQNRRLLARARLRERVGCWLVADLTNVKWVENPKGGFRPSWIGAQAPCDLPFDTKLAPCERPGDCPHQIPVHIEETDNNQTEGRKRAMRCLRRRAGPQPKVPKGRAPVR